MPGAELPEGSREIPGKLVKPISPSVALRQTRKSPQFETEEMHEQGFAYSGIILEALYGGSKRFSDGNGKNKSLDKIGRILSGPR